MRSMIGLTVVLAALSPLAAADWTGFMGPDRNGISKETGLAKTWPDGGPKLVWKTDKAGLGYAGMAVAGGKLYTMGARGDDEFALAFDDKGKELWATKLGPVHDWKANSWSRGPNATPAIDGERVYCLSSKGALACLNTKDGKEVWKLDLPTKLNGEVNPVGGGIPKFGWGYTWSPIVDGDQLIIPAGGPDGLIAALDKKDGKLLWRSKTVKEQATYATPALATINGVKQVIYVHQKGVVSVSAKDGTELWHHKKDDDYPDVVCATPVVKGDHVYVSVGYGAGSELLKVANGKATSVYSEKTIANKQSGVVLVDKHVYGYHEDRNWACQDFATGEIAWPKKRTKQTVKAGGMIVADGRIYTLDEQGMVAMLELSPKEYKLISSFPLPETSKSKKARGGIWTYPALSDGKLYVRDQELVFCYQVK